MFLFVFMLGLCFFSKESSQSFLGRPQLFGPSEALVKKYAELKCELEVYPKNETILLQLYKEGQRNKVLGYHSCLPGQVCHGNFPLVVQLSYEGYLECVASAQNNSDIEPTLSNIHYLKVIVPVKNAKVNVSSGPREFFEGRTLKLDCELSAGNHVSYKWLLNDRPVTESPLHHFRDNHLRIYRPTSADSGSYMCVATNYFNKTVFTSNSSQVVITVKGQSFLGRPRLFGPSEALVRKFAECRCELEVYPKNETILLQLYKEGKRDKVLAVHSCLPGQVCNGTFPMVVQLSYEGYLECVASVLDNSDIEPSVSNIHHLKVIVPVKDAKVNFSSGPREFFEGRTLKLDCELSAGNHVSYKWLLNDRPVTESPLHHFRDNHLRIYRPTSADSGSYMCVATNYFNKTVHSTSNSSKVVITVKDVVSPPDISFTVLKEDSHNYSAVVTCQSTRGTPPVTFSLYNIKDLVANVTVEERSAVFKIPVVLNQHLWLKCQAENGDQVAHSQPLPLEVVPVGGPVTIRSDIHLGENYAVIALSFFTC